MKITKFRSVKQYVATQGWKSLKTEVCKIINEARELVPSPYRSTRARVAAASEKATVESLPCNGRRSDRGFSDAANRKREDIPIQEVYESDRTKQSWNYARTVGRSQVVT